MSTLLVLLIQLLAIGFSASHSIAFCSSARTRRCAFGIHAATDNLLHEILQVAIDASQRAGDIILQHVDGAEVVETKSTNRDLLTRVDPLCEKVRRIEYPLATMIDNESNDKNHLAHEMVLLLA